MADIFVWFRKLAWSSAEYGPNGISEFVSKLTAELIFVDLVWGNAI